MSLKRISICAVLIFSTFCFAADKTPVAKIPGNVLTDFSFEEGGRNWNIWGGGVSNVARSGRAGVTIRNEESRWSGLSR